MIVKAAKQSKEKAAGSEAKEVKVTEFKNNDQSVDITETPNQSAVTEASNYETADEQQDSTLQKTTASGHETVDFTDKQLVNGNTSEATQDVSKDAAATTEDKTADSQDEAGTVDLTEDDNGNEDVVEVLVGKGRGTPTKRGAASRNKARRAKKI